MKLGRLKNTAFSLTEFMIVLSIIGMLAAILAPVLSKSKPDEITLNYRKTVYALANAVANMTNDPVLYQPNAAGEIDLDVPNNGGAGDGNGTLFCKNLADQLNTVGAIRCPSNTDVVNADLINLDLRNEAAARGNMIAANRNFVLGNGAAIGGIITPWGATQDNTDVAAAVGTNQFMTLCIDVNGFAKGPNRGCSAADRALANRDQYRIRIYRNGRIGTGSSLGPNNWYAENIMLMDPRKIVQDKREWSVDERVVLTKDTGNEGTISFSDRNADLEKYGYVFVETDGNKGYWTFIAKNKKSTCSSSSSK